MRFLATSAFLFLLTASTAEPGFTCKVEPAIFCVPFEEMSAELSQADGVQLLAATPRDIILMHHGFGMAIRNRFDLWQDNELTRFFRGNGVDHPDSMSGPFIMGFIGYLEGREVTMTEEIGKILPPRPPPPPPPEPSG